jgi:carotenoid cleavage dioxygenase-like enzyme
MYLGNLLWLFVNPLLTGEFTPVEKEIKKNIIVDLSNKRDKEILNKVNGFYGQIGPNPKFYNQSDEYNLFDGNGMIQGIFINNNNLTFQNHWIRTDKFNFENAIGSKLPISIGNFYKNNNFLFYPILNLLEKFNLFPNMMGTANTALFKGFPGKKWLGKKFNKIKSITTNADTNSNTVNNIIKSTYDDTHETIYALHERDKPYMIDIDFKNKNINTIKKININSEYFTAHPKVFGNSTYVCVYNTFKPEVIIYEYDDSFKIINYKRIKTKYINMIHDIAITENYIIIIDTPFNFDAKNILKGKMPFYFDLTQKNRILLIDRNLSSDETKTNGVKVIECDETFLIFHFDKIKETKDIIILDTIFHSNFNLELTNVNITSTSKYRRIIIDKDKLSYKVKKNNYFEKLNLEFPISNEKYSILSIFGKSFDINGFLIVKDFQYIKKKILIDRKIYAEPSITDSNCIICFTYDKNYNSYLYIYDIKTNSELEIKLDIQMIKGFHSIFINNKL